MTGGDQGGKLGGARGGVPGAEDEASGILDGRAQDGLEDEEHCSGKGFWFESFSVLSFSE